MDAAAPRHALDVLQHAEPVGASSAHAQQVAATALGATVVLVALRPPFVVAEGGSCIIWGNVLCWSLMASMVSFAFE